MSVLERVRNITFDDQFNVGDQHHLIISDRPYILEWKYSSAIGMSMHALKGYTNRVIEEKAKKQLTVW